MRYGNTRHSRVRRAVRSLGRVQADIAAALCFLVLVNVVFFVPGLRDVTVVGASVRTLLGIPALLVLPGYVVVAIAYPGQRPADGRATGSLDRLERIALWFGMSLAILPMFGVVLGTLWSFTPSVVVTGYTVALTAGIGLVAVRRFRLAPDRRAGTPIEGVISTFEPPLGNTGRRKLDVSTIALGIAIVLAVGAIGVVVATPYQSGSSSTFYLVTENETGVQTASGYPTTLAVGEPETLTVGITNDEDRSQAYTVIATLERVDTASATAEAVESEEVARLHRVLEEGEDWTGRHEITPSMAGEDLRLHYALYRGESGPANPETADAYRDVYLWVNVTGA